MKLSEVKIERPVRSPETFGDYTQRLRFGDKEMGSPKQKAVGSGLYADVFQHPKHKAIVVKVSRKGSQILDFIKYAVKNQDNPYIPKIYGVRRYANRNGEYYIIFMEKLGEYVNFNDRMKLQILRKHVGRQADDFAEQHGHVEDFFQDDLDNIIHKLKMDPHMKRSEQLLKVLSFLRRAKASDVNDSNIMLRGRDQIVFTDPTT